MAGAWGVRDAAEPQLRGGEEPGMQWTVKGRPEEGW